MVECRVIVSFVFFVVSMFSVDSIIFWFWDRLDFDDKDIVCKSFV